MFLYNLKLNGNRLVKFFFIVMLLIILVIFSVGIFNIFFKNENRNSSEIKLTDLPISDRFKSGTTISKLDIIDTFIVKELEEKNEKKKVEKENLTLDEVDKRILTIDDFLDEVEKS